MTIDFRTLYTQWINLDDEVGNAKHMRALLDGLGFQEACRVSAIRRSANHPCRPGESHYPGIAESQLLSMKNILDHGPPGLILEDDVDISEHFEMRFEIPDDADAFYLGTSHGDGQYSAVDIGGGLCRIHSMLSAHAVLYLSRRYLEDLIEYIPGFLETRRLPFDVGVAALQKNYRIYAFHAPPFFQSDTKNNRNKWESITRTPLRVRNSSSKMEQVVSFTRLGRWGRLGNQMFQYAVTLAVAHGLGARAVAPLGNSTLPQYFRLGGVVDGMPETIDQIYYEDSFAFDDEVHNLAPDLNVELFGYFQSERNFSNCSDLIREDFEFTSSVLKTTEALLHQLNPTGRKTVSLHVRRGDYVDVSDIHPPLPVSYYEEALGHFDDHLPIVVSDDLDWCEKHLAHLDPVYSDGKDDGTDLCLISLCDGHIIANSSFSWWGAWLGRGRTVAPAKWFGSRGPAEWADVYCEDWLVL